VSTALLLIDLQYDFLDPGVNEHTGRLNKAICLPGVRRCLAHAREQDWKIVHVVTEHSGVATLPSYLRSRNAPPYCIADTHGAQIIEGLHKEGDAIVRKQMYDGFTGTNLASVVEDFPSIIVCGVTADCCVVHTANTASATLGRHVAIPYDAVSATTIEDYVVGLRTAAKSLADVLDSGVIGAEKDLEVAHVNPHVHHGKLEPTWRRWYQSCEEIVEKFAEAAPGADTWTTSDSATRISDLEALLNVVRP
jgi:nicotinamidase-related amidase